MDASVKTNMAFAGEKLSNRKNGASESGFAVH